MKGKEEPLKTAADGYDDAVDDADGLLRRALSLILIWFWSGGGREEEEKGKKKEGGRTKRHEDKTKEQAQRTNGTERYGTKQVGADDDDDDGLEKPLLLME